MNIIFLTLVRISNIEERGIYSDLMRKFRDEGHNVYIVTPQERRLVNGSIFSVHGAELVESDGVHILNVNTFNIQKTNIVEKGLGTLLLESQYKAAIMKYLGDVSFDLITYSTPPITFTNVVRYLKKQNPQAVTYLQLKDIFPQNAIDIGMMSKSGVKGLLYKFFRNKEKKLYAASDYIGCMSPANVDFVLKHNSEIDPSRVEVAPNSIELVETVKEPGQEETERLYIRKKYDLPTNIPIFIYGGNLGKPQGIDYLVKCLDANKNRMDCFFVVVGSGTHYNKIAYWMEDENNKMEGVNVKLMRSLPKVDYDILVRSCDVGLIFLDHRFTIPNYPSRLLSYLENKMPVLCATDPNTDIGKIAEENGYGYWCESVKPEDFTAMVDKMLKSDIKSMGEMGHEFLKKNYQVENTYRAIISHMTMGS